MFKFAQLRLLQIPKAKLVYSHKPQKFKEIRLLLFCPWKTAILFRGYYEFFFFFLSRCLKDWVIHYNAKGIRNGKGQKRWKGWLETFEIAILLFHLVVFFFFWFCIESYIKKERERWEAGKSEGKYVIQMKCKVLFRKLNVSFLSFLRE